MTTCPIGHQRGLSMLKRKRDRLCTRCISHIWVLVRWMSSMTMIARWFQWTIQYPTRKGNRPVMLMTTRGSPRALRRSSFKQGWRSSCVGISWSAMVRIMDDTMGLLRQEHSDGIKKKEGRQPCLFHRYYSCHHSNDIPSTETTISTTTADYMLWYPVEDGNVRLDSHIAHLPCIFAAAEDGYMSHSLLDENTSL